MMENKIIALILIASFKSSFICLSIVPRRQLDENLQVEISNGVLQGKHIVSECNNVSYYGFFGIPYAQPPVGDLRFRAPQPALNWTSILNATTEGSKCPQLSEGSENCLFLNVYTPRTQKQQDVNNNLLPVMVNIHGGAFIFGSTHYENYGPDYLIGDGVVVVTFNYRLGVFGFLSTGDMASPGNYGLKDQIEALKWVQKNIQHFGGNPSQVTIIGESAGAASVHYLLQTPLAKGLFHRAISESGSTLCNWSLYGHSRKIAFRIAELAGVETNNTEELVTRLRSIEFEELASIGEDIAIEELQNLYDDGIPFSPCIEPDHENAMITKGSYELLSSNQFHKVPLLTGFNSQESALLMPVMDMVKSDLTLRDASPSIIVHKNMNISSNITKTEVGLSIKSFYFGKGLAARAPIDNILDFLSDDSFLRSILKTVELHSQSVPVYFYRFSYESPSAERIVRGVAHGEQIGYIFCSRNNKSLLLSKNHPSTSFKLDNIKNSVSSKMVKLWTNFARTGNPTPIPDQLLNNVIWPVAIKKRKFTFMDFINSSPKRTDITFLDINECLTVNVNPRKEAMVFWENLFQKYPSLDGTF